MSDQTVTGRQGEPPGPETIRDAGRGGPDETDIHNWVALSGVSPEAAALYNLLRHWDQRQVRRG